MTKTIEGFDLQNWAVIAGIWGMSDGVLTPSQESLYVGHPHSTEQAIVYLKDAAWADFTWRVKFRLQDASAYGPRFHFRCPSNHSGYRVSIRAAACDPEVRLCKQAEGGFPTELTYVNIPSLESNKWYELTISCSGPEISVALDGKTLITAQDADFSAGMMGLSLQHAEKPVDFGDSNITGQPAANVDVKLHDAPTSYREYQISATQYGLNYNAFPGLTELRDGRLLCAYRTSHSHVGFPNEHPHAGASFLVLTESEDQGRTWWNHRLLPEMPYPCGCGYLQRLADGGLWLDTQIYYDYPPGNYRFDAPPPPGSFSGVFGMAWSRSFDEGKTWTPWTYCDAPYDAYTSEPKTGWFTFNPVRELPDGTLVKPAYLGSYIKESAKEPFWQWACGVLRSNDGGRTWKGFLAEPLSGTLPAKSGLLQGDTEPDIELLPDGRLIMVTRRDEPLSRGGVSFSADGGQSWQPLARLGWHQHSPNLLLTSEGVLLCAHRWVGTSIHYSLDYGTTWSKGIEIANPAGAYPRMIELANGKVLIAYYADHGYSRFGVKAVAWGQTLIVNKKGVFPDLDS